MFANIVASAIAASSVVPKCPKLKTDVLLSKCERDFETIVGHARLKRNNDSAKNEDMLKRM